MSLVLFDTLFGSKARARLIRFFLVNPGTAFSSAEVAEKTLVPRADVARELTRLTKMKLLFERSQKGKKHFIANEEFPFYTELKSLVSKLNIHAQSRS